MGEEERCKLEREILGEPCGVDCPLNYGQELDGTNKEVDGWVIPAVEVKRVQEERDSIATTSQDYYSRENSESVYTFDTADLSPLIVDIHGVLLLRSSSSSIINGPLIPTPSSINSLRQIALHISSRLPTLLTSPPSAGKALLISHIAKLLHPQSQNQIVTIHLADTSLDPRALLGSYVSSAVHPGTFEWKEGVLVRSMREGKWVVLEDIDQGSNEVLAVIKPLVESLTICKWIGGRAQLDVPGQGRVVAHYDFMLFGTRSLQPSRAGRFQPPAFFGSHRFSEVIIESPTFDELQTIISAKFPRLAGSPARVIIELWDSIKKLSTHNSSRDVGLRELQRFCHRIDSLLPPSYQPMDIAWDGQNTFSLADIFPNISLREDIYLDARDVFFGAGTLTASSLAHSKLVAQTIGDRLGLDTDRQQWVLAGKVSELEMETDANGQTLAIRLGRTRLPARANKQQIWQPDARPFALHKPALALLSRIGKAVSHNEPVLLTGETGTGKTSVISYLATLLHRPLISLNLSHQTESSDLIGGLKPIDARIPGSVLQEKFIQLFGSTFSIRKNAAFEAEVRKSVNECKWKRAVGLWKESVRMAIERIHAKKTEDTRLPEALDNDAPRKRRKTHAYEPKSSEYAWSTFLHDVEEFEVQHVHGKGKFAFGFVEGPLIKALRSGDWVLLDEVNLASPETLECISGLLHGPTSSITLTEHGSLEPVPRHPDFRLFACMNPATDVGKKDLPPTIRSRFTEIDVPPPDADKETLLSIIAQYIGHIAVGDKRIIMDIAEFYTAVKEVAESRQIADGANHRPHFSMRTLVRALTFAADTASKYSLRRSVWEGCLMAFTMALDGESAKVVTALAHKYLLSVVKNFRSVLAKDPAPPSDGIFIKLGPFYLEKGPLEDDLVEEYIITPSVEQKLIDLSRIILTRRFPVLIEGPTSSGKTSSIEYLAKRTGHRFVRINNHEHTDIQEYLGSYVSDPFTGKLIFKDGLLVQALRHGYWIVLDELNLAPTDVLEALNRLLDDNRELVIPETQEVVHPHPHFMLFATQNPPGLYAGRKILSRAFRNRFLEVHFEDVPQIELETILCQRCRIAPSYGKKIVNVFHELQKRRQTSRVFESKQGFATLRDLFRWAGRDAVGYQELAENGYMLLAERARRPEDKIVVKEVIETIMKVKIDEDMMYNLFRADIDMSTYLGHPVPATPSITWTKAMQRLYILVCRGLKFNEPILLVGETGSGKTSVCQVFADASSQRLLALNCHQNTETADLIGGLRPVRNRSALQAEAVRQVSLILNAYGINDVPSSVEGLAKSLSSIMKNIHESDSHSRHRLQVAHQQLLQLNSIFEWHDGPLIEAMNEGDVFLLDEISLADDSVLERLNSVLEPGRSIVLAERGGTNLEQAAVRASDSFKLLATMNPGGDYGKKELSPALRNRFTEIWVPSVDDRDDLELIVGSLWSCTSLQSYTTCLLDFVEWLCSRVGDRSLMSLRDILAWVVFTNSAYKENQTEGLQSDELFHHAAHMTYLDGLSSLPQLAAYSREAMKRLRSDAIAKLQEIVPLHQPLGSAVQTFDSTKFIQLGSFAIEKGKNAQMCQSFNLNAPTTMHNAMRVVRACQVPKPILLEGSPGVGKTSLITALAQLTGHTLCRINLSDQTDLIDLFGSDLPVEGGSAGEFAWKDAEFLRALQEGHWVLLDEMNLAPQAVLEGLNAVLDHRGTVYIPELNRSFQRHPSFRIFAAQNPLHQGGGRKGLPKSFVNRFSKVYVEELTPADLYTVCSHIFPDLGESTLQAMISFNLHLNDSVTVQRLFAQDGSPWEFNLRDIIRWGTLTSHSHHTPLAFLRSIYLHRFRSIKDRQNACSIFNKVFSVNTNELENSPPWMVSASEMRIGHFQTTRHNKGPMSRPTRFLKSQLSALEALGNCVSQSWLAILTGPKYSGKSSIVRTLANYSGHRLCEVFVNSATDTMDILGSFEQVDLRRRLTTLLDDLVDVIDIDIRSIAGSKVLSKYRHEACDLRNSCYTTSDQDFQRLYQKVETFISRLVALGPPSINQYKRIFTSLADLSSFSSIGQFEWVDGPLIKAMKSGDWIMLDGANLCGPSVLDRLNSLCEMNGFLTLSERGFVNGEVQVVKPHPNFRLFMSVDPHYGELSRAMRNRGIEIALIDGPISDDQQILQDHYRLPRVLPAASSGGYISQITLFDAVRRGLLQAEVERSPLLTSTGRCLDQDSALSNLLDQAPNLIFSSLPINVEVPWIPFLSRTLVPAYIPYVLRYVSHSRYQMSCQPILVDFLEAFPQQELRHALANIRTFYLQRKQTSDAFLLAQPMDFFWIEGTSFEKSFGTHGETLRSLTFEILSLSAVLFISKRENLVEMDERIPQKEKNIQAHHSVLKLSQYMIDISEHIIKSASVMDSGVDSVKLASKILGYRTHLIAALNSSAYDFSALYAVSNWLLDNLSKSPPTFDLLLQESQTLHSIVSLSSGRGLFNLWSNMYIEEMSGTILQDVRRTDEMASLLKQSSDVPNLRRQSFDLMSMETLPPSLKSPKSTSLLGLKKLLDECLVSNSNASIAGSFYIESNSILLELFIVASSATLGTDRQLVISSMQQILKLAFDNAGTSLLRLVPYQHLLWSQEVGAVSAGLIAKAQIRLLEGLWEVQPHIPISGPSILLHPFSLYKIIKTCDMGQVDLLSLAQHEYALHQQGRLVVLESKQNTDRVVQLIHLFFQTLHIVATSFRPSSDTSYEFIKNVKIGNRTQLLDFLHQMMSLLQTSSDEIFATSIRRQFLPLMQRMSDSTPLQTLGLAWIGVSRVLSDLAIPDTPIDPAVVQNSKYNWMRSEEETLNASIRLHQQLEKLLTGNQDNDVSKHLTASLVDIRAQLEKLPILPPRSDISRLHLFWSEIVQFQTNVLSHSKIDALIDSFIQSNQNASLRERVTQESLAGFYHRLDSVYPEFADISILLKLSIQYMRLGLRLVAESNSSSDNVTRTKWVTSLISFPTACSSDRIIRCFGNADTSLVPASHNTLLTLAALSVQNSLGIQTGAYWHLVETAYEQILRLWLIDRAKEKQQISDDSTLYRKSKLDHRAVTDADLEEHEFLSLFPNFENVFDEETRQQDSNSTSHPGLVVATDMETLIQIHYNLMDSPHGISKGTMRNIFQKLRDSSVQNLFITSSESLPDTLDRISYPFQFSLLRDSMLALESNHKMDRLSYNFYMDSNYKELKRAASVILALKQRLEGILEEWPDQMVVKHLMERCDDILTTSSKTSVAKMLSMVEQVLVQSQDWEMYSNKDNSIKSNQEEIVRLVVDWRRLELSCWQSLLDSQAKTFTDELSEWWFRLYDAVIRGTLAAFNQDLEDPEQAVNRYLDTLIPLLDSFITSSPLGQFHARLKMLNSFETYITKILIHKSSKERTILSRVLRILHATYVYHSLFSENLRKRLADEKASLESEVKALIKLASWKDVNVQALKQSAQKSHRQLYKIVRKFRDVLRQPVTEDLQVQSPSDSEHQALSMEAPIDSSSSMSTSRVSLNGRLKGLKTPDYLVNLEVTFEKYSSLVENMLRPAVQCQSAHAVDSFAVEIITTSKDLASITVPLSLTAQVRQKHQKALLVRKRKAFSDMLKALKHAGLASNVKPEILRQNSSQQWVREQPILRQTSMMDLDIQKGNMYFAKLCGTLPALRALLPNHHADVTTRELQRGLMFLESGFSMAVDLRARLANALPHHQKLTDTLKRLHALKSHTDLVVAGQNVLAHVSSVYDLLSKCSHALSELRDNVIIFNQIDPPDSGIDNFLQQVCVLASSTDTMCERVFHVLGSLNSTPISFLTQDESGLLMEAQRHISRTQDAISGWHREQPSFAHLLLPILQWLSDQHIVPLDSTISGAVANPNQMRVDQFISSLLVSVQAMVSKVSSNTSGKEEEEAETEKYLFRGYQLIRDCTHVLNLERISNQLDEVLRGLSTSADLHDTLDNLLPFLSVYLPLVADQLFSLNNWTKSIFKLDFVLCSVLQTLSQQGFCIPPESEGSEAGGESSNVPGVGIGEGSGTENVVGIFRNALQGRKGRQGPASLVMPPNLRACLRSNRD
ncbi:Midasin [Psilocybe cubensis]|uniref:Midasin n=1 Tax=Psilocybe cubensis TaxID=181762 RepID=A0ACB8H064_PSICU|nr:Midasin [Psilocybe cubensis]KAH9480590.1 Midasin [Psilocybe cubensis]